MNTILLISPYWKERHRWMVSSFKLAELWQRMGYRVVAVCMGSETKVEKLSETLTVHSRKDFFLPDPLNFGIAFGFAGYVRRLIREVKPDLIVINKALFWTSFAIIPLALTGHRILLLTDALVGMTWWPRGVLPKILMAIGAWTAGWLVLLSASHIVFFHPQPAALLAFLGIRRKSRVIPTGIDEARYRRERRSAAEIIVTYVGRLESVKGVDDFLAAAAPLRREFPNLRLQVVGYHKEHHPLVARYRDHVAFFGLRDDIPALLGTTDVFVLPSYSEGLSNALMEAMASSCACIATAVGGNTHLLDDGCAGLLFPPGDRAMLRDHLCTLIADPARRERIGKAARDRIEKIYSWRFAQREYARLFADALRA